MIRTKSTRIALPLLMGTLLMLMVLSLGCAPTIEPELAVGSLGEQIDEADTAADTRAVETLFTFDSGSSGSDGALILETPGMVDFFAMFPDADNIYHFTAITVAAGVTVDMSGVLQPPVHWLASGHVQIDGYIDLNGQHGHGDSGTIANSLPGAGGFMGGQGNFLAAPAQHGAGPGRGLRGTTGGGAGHTIDGIGYYSNSGSAYGNEFVLPLIGGSGGGGSYSSSVSDKRGGGGAGGGALLIASSSSVQINGTITAEGGDAGDAIYDGGGGSGGALRIIAPLIDGSGSLFAGRGNGKNNGGHGSHGRIRLEAFRHDFNGTVNPPLTLSTPGRVFLPTEVTPIRITHIGGVAVPENPVGGFNPADVTINASGETILEIEARGIPVGVIPVIELVTSSGNTVVATSSPLVGSVLTSTATATVTIPSGFSQFTVQADWSP